MVEAESPLATVDRQIEEPVRCELTPGRVGAFEYITLQYARNTQASHYNRLLFLDTSRYSTIQTVFLLKLSTALPSCEINTAVEANN
jgi:hypothetical protein